MAKSFNPKTVSWWHEQLADWMLLNPDRSIKEAAIVFDVGVNYLYLLKNSDTFKEYWNQRRAAREAKLDDNVGEMLGTVQNKVSAVADIALDQLLEQLEKNQAAQSAGAPIITHDELRSTADMALKKLGYGLPAPGNGASPVQNTQINVSIDAGMLSEAREKMKKLHGVQTYIPEEPKALKEEKS